MRRRPIVRPRAKADVDDIALYIARDDLKTAVDFTFAAEAAFRRLAAFPGLGPQWQPQIPEYPDLRFWPITRFRKYLVLYRPSGKTVEILRVIHGARDVGRVMGGT